MGPQQDWCLQCGAGAPNSLGSSTPSWRSGGVVLIAALLLALGAAALGYAALNKGSGNPRTLTTTVAQSTVPATVPPVATTPAATTLGATKAPTTPGATKPALPSGIVKPPKIPLTAPTPRSSGTTTSPSKATTPTTTPSPSLTGGSNSSSRESQPTAILLDTNAASTYNPYNYPATNFGDPSLAIDGDTSTGWTALVDPTTAPKMAEGLLIDLKSQQKISAIELITSTPGLTVQVYGAKGATVPTSITEPAWVPLSHSRVAKKRRTRIALRDSAKAFGFLTVWISKAPAASVGAPRAPGHVSVNELELFP